MATGNQPRPAQAGFTYLGALFLVALMGAALAAVGQLWSTTGQRAREQELLWVGTQYARALQSYYRNSPGVARYPERLEQLLEDDRFPTPMRHLRRLYPDPIGRGSEWGLITSVDGGIAGVHSLAEGRPFKRSRFPARWIEFEGVQSYAEWHFVAEKAFLDMPAANPTAGVTGAARALAVRP